MATKPIPPPLNTSRPILWQEHYVCPDRPTYVEHHLRVHPNFIPVAWGIQSWVIGRGTKVALKDGRRRLVGDQIITKPQGQTRSVIAIRDYRYHGNFDASAFRIPVGERHGCPPFPAQATVDRVRIADGVFPLDDLKLIEAR